MGKEEEIWDKLLAGKTQKELIEEGYSKSTVYKVYSKFKRGTIRKTPSYWEIPKAKIRFNRERYLPGDGSSLTFSLKNTSNRDLYVNSTGVQPEWLEGEWYAIESRTLLHPLEEKQFSIPFTIPNIALGEYMIRFGLNGYYLPLREEVTEKADSWSNESVYIQVKKPRKDYRIFISHSIKDMNLIRPLEKTLDNHGLIPIIAEDIREPSSYLPEKFERLISRSHLFLGILTSNSIRSEWVKHEIDYAYKGDKQSILLVEKGANIKTDYEYVSFSMNEPIENITEKVIENIKKIRRNTKQSNKDFVDPVVVGLIAFMAGLLLGSYFTSR